jgi:hypothetical protein
VSVNQRDRAIAQQRLNELTAPASTPVDSALAPTDTAGVIPAAPRDTIQIAPPR